MNELDVLLRCTVKGETVICFIDSNHDAYILNVTMPHGNKMTKYERVSRITDLIEKADSIQYWNPAYLKKDGNLYYLNPFQL